VKRGFCSATPLSLEEVLPHGKEALYLSTSYLHARIDWNAPMEDPLPQFPEQLHLFLRER